VCCRQDWAANVARARGVQCKYTAIKEEVTRTDMETETTVKTHNRHHSAEVRCATC
jgi:hypothetical protein